MIDPDANPALLLLGPIPHGITAGAVGAELAQQARARARLTGLEFSDAQGQSRNRRPRTRAFADVFSPQPIPNRPDMAAVIAETTLGQETGWPHQPGRQAYGTAWDGEPGPNAPAIPS